MPAGLPGTNPGGTPGTWARKTRRRVRVADALARVGITVGGIAVIVAVTAILVYLFATSLPLLAPGRLGVERRITPQWGGAVQAGLLDEYMGSGLFLTDGDEFVSVSIASGDVLARLPIPRGERGRTAASALAEGGAIAFGYDDGSLQVGTIGFTTDFLTAPADTDPLAGLNVGERRSVDGGYAERTIEGQFRRTRAQVNLAEPVKLESGSGPVVLVDYDSTGAQQFAAAMRADGTTVLNQVRTIVPLGGGKPRLRLTSRPVAYTPREGIAELPSWLFITGDGAHIILLWPDGVAQRYGRTGDAAAPLTLAETRPLLHAGEHVKTASKLLGALTIMIGDDRGGLTGVFPARSRTIETPDGYTLAVAHRFHDARADAALGISARDRSFIAGGADGSVSIRNMTSQKVIATIPGQDADSVGSAGVGDGGGPSAARAVMIAPKLDGIARVGVDGVLSVWSLDHGHPEASLLSLFGKVWYEGDAAPAFTYQSTAGTDNAEPKISLVPLIFGTIKATVFAMLFAVPIAVFAAVYTSEMLHPRVRLGIKPVIEMMASLPSVVLGFVAAMVVAPLARDLLPSILLGLVVLPYSALAAAYLWQLLPARLTSRLRTYQHLLLVTAVLIFGLGVARVMGPVAERALFAPSPSDVLFLAGSHEDVPRDQWPAWARERTALTADDGRRLHESGLYVTQGRIVRPVGSPSEPEIASRIAAQGLDRADIKQWLDGVAGSPWPGWMMLLTLPALIGVVLLRGGLLDRRLHRSSLPRFGPVAAVVELVKFIATALAGLSLASAGATLLTTLGLDTRDLVFGTFSQRNTLVVAIVMGFAVIPIIYTISEDAMSSVPGPLRSAALGCGATRWQTAMSVVMPLALSGIFSACMIGLGRAAGETMIVLMATGNTPSMDWNIFSGFRTLAANIAVEMPEAPKGETHYRVLFLAGLCLFLMTFFVNTAAEILRQRVRRKGAGL